MLPAQVAEAQLPPVPDCVSNPASCLPDPEVPPLPEVDPCVANPASCLPDPELPPVPDVDECVKNPASCLPDPPPIDQCTKNPASCLPDVVPDPDECVKDLPRCLPDAEEIDRCVEDVARCVQPGENRNDDGDEDEGGGAAPGEGNQPPRQSPDATSRIQRSADADAEAAVSGEATASSLEGGTEIGTAAFASSPSTLERIQQGLEDAAKRFAFPLALAGLVAGFLLVQGRLDRRDPKLAVAPIVARDDVVSFR
jgi:hypothetical protein